MEIYILCGVAHWGLVLAVSGEPWDVRTSRLSKRLRVHATALGISILAWPVFVPVALATGRMP
tara:strand:+ start:596 stop:784 length:189 start_codon:yes stop_codon:yes gene_type:complete